MNGPLPDPPRIAGRFLVRRSLGAGGFGIVYEVLDVEQQAVIALKTLRRSDSEALFRLKREFRTLTDITHPNLVTLYELLSEDDQWFFTMELVEGVNFLDYIYEKTSRSTAGSSDPTITVNVRSLADRTPTPPLTEILAAAAAGPDPDIGRLRSALGQLARAVNALHQAGQLHLDLKPSNVLVTPQDRVVVLDFGLISEKTSPPDSASRQIAGTPAYIAPEQVAGEALSEATDWYAVGVMLFQALTGKLPFTGSIREIFEAKLRGQPPASPTVRPGVPKELGRLSTRLLRRNPIERPDAGEIFRCLGLISDAAMLPTAGSDSIFVGRRPQLETLYQAFEEVKRGGTVRILVHGGSGIGKTAFVQNFLAGLRRDEPCLVLAGRCYEQEFARYQALDSVVDSLSKYLASLPREEVDAILPPYAFLLSRMFPVLQPMVDSIPIWPEPPDPREARRQAFTCLRNLLRNLAKRKPLVVFIDDLHWSDADSGPLIAEILRGPDPPPLLWITCRRNVEPTDPGVIAVPLEELTEDESRELAAFLVGTDRRRSHALARESGGNPLFLHELARQSAGIGQLVRMEHAIETRIAGLSEAARRILEVAAVASRPVPRDVAREAADIGAHESGALAQLRGARLLRTRSAEGRPDLEIYHDRIRTAVLSRVAPQDLREHHAQLAMALERAGRAGPETLLLHFQGAGDRAKTAHYAVAAGEQSSRTFAFRSAAEYFRIALDASVLDTARSAQVRVSLADSLVNAGMGAQAAEIYRAAADDQSEAATQIDLLRRAGWQYLLSGHPVPGLELIREVLRRVGLPLASNRRQALLILLWRRARIAFRGYRFRETDAARLDRWELLRVDTCWSLAQGLSMIDMFQAASFQGLHLLLALRAGEPTRIASAFCVEAAFFALRGPAGDRKSKNLLARAAAISMRINDPRLTGFVSLVTGMSAFLRGCWKESREAMENAEEILRGKCVGVAWELATARLVHCVSLFFLGELRELGSRLPGLLENAELRGDMYEATDLRIRISHAHLLTLDRAREAAAEVERATANWPRDRFYLQHWWSLIASVEIHLYANEPERAWQSILSSWPDLRRSLLLRVQYVRVESLYHRACAGLALGTPAGVRAASKDAARLDRENAPWVVPLAGSLRAGVAAAHGRFIEAAELLARVESDFERADMAMFAAAARRLRGELIGDSSGREIADTASRFMREQGVSDPAAMARMLIPVCTKGK